ncbi:hypothetical protein GCM10010341_68180 [Streptomyces noursei]|nr:hypothetical protein GCM10010341_68180 [Streptomyces noursei]
MLPAVCGALTIVMVLGAVAPSVALPIPLVFGTVSFPLPVPLLLPLLPVCLILHGQSRGDLEAEKVAVRPIGARDAVTMATLVTLACLVGAVEAWSGRTTGVAMARDFAGYLGLALVMRRVGGPGAANVAVALFPFACASFGMRSSGHPRVWAWPFHEPGSAVAAVTAVFLLVGGLAVARQDPLIKRWGDEE